MRSDPVDDGGGEGGIAVISQQNRSFDSPAAFCFEAGTMKSGGSPEQDAVARTIRVLVCAVDRAPGSGGRKSILVVPTCAGIQVEGSGAGPIRNGEEENPWQQEQSFASNSKRIYKGPWAYGKHCDIKLENARIRNRVVAVPRWILRS